MPTERPENRFDRTVCRVQYPKKGKRTPTKHVLRHFFSDDQMAGCHDAVALHPHLLHSDYVHMHHLDDQFFKGNFRDGMYPQIEYITQKFNDCCGRVWEKFRFLHNITRLSA